MYIPFRSETHRQKRTKQPGLLVRMCKRGINGSICIADAARSLFYKHPGNDENLKLQTRSPFPVSVTLPLGPSLHNGAYDRAMVSLLPEVPNRVKVPSILIWPRFFRMLDDRHRLVFAEGRNFSLRATPAADNIDRTWRETPKTLDRVEVPSIDDREESRSEIHGASDAQLSGENADSVAGTAGFTEAQPGSECNLSGDKKSGALDRSQHRRVSEESEKTMVYTSSKGSRLPSVEEEEPLGQPSIREALADGAVTGLYSNKAEAANHRTYKDVAAILEQPTVGVQNVQQGNGRLKAENEALRAKIEELKSLKDTSEELNVAYGEQARAETREKAEVEQWLVEETTEVIELEQQLVDERRAYYELLRTTCQQAKRAARDMAQSKAFGRRAFERMILLCHMLTRFGVDTRDDDHQEISCQALDIVGADEMIISAGFAGQARNALKELAKPDTVNLRRQREIEHMEHRMADVLADENFRTCRYDGRWINMRTGDEIKKREKVGGKDKNLEHKSAEFVEEIAQDSRWIPGMKVYHHFWETSLIPSPTKAELEDVYKQDGNDKCLITTDSTPSDADTYVTKSRVSDSRLQPDFSNGKAPKNPFLPSRLAPTHNLKITSREGHSKVKT